ncbi:carboxypeptidase-like regulatory domain-containing protein, partial [bacterium]|nr:carboxypeptidase-like regulatory domain-containing protein [bacterium]
MISGTIKDVATGEDLIGATIVVDEMRNTGTISNSYGFFSISLPANSYKIRFQFVGYETQFIPVNLTENKRLDIELKEKSVELGNIVITGERADRNVTSVEMGNVKITPKQIESIPVLFG